MRFIKGFFRMMLYSIIYLFVAYFLAVQIAYYISLGFDGMLDLTWKNYICLNPRVMFWQGDYDYFWLATAIIMAGLLTMFLSWFFGGTSKAKRQQEKEERKKTNDEKLQYSHLASKHESKKGLTRIQFDRTGNMCNVFQNPNSRDSYSKFAFIVGHVIIIALIYIGHVFLLKIIKAIIHIFNEDFKFSFLNHEWLTNVSSFFYISVGLLLIAIFLFIGAYTGFIYERQRGEKVCQSQHKKTLPPTTPQAVSIPQVKIVEEKKAEEQPRTHQMSIEEMWNMTE